MFRRHVARFLSAYCEGALPPPEASRVAGHILNCGRCRREMERVRAGVRLATMLRPLESPQSLSMPYPVAASRVSSPRPRLRWGVGLSFAVAAMVTLVAGASGRPGALFEHEVRSKTGELARLRSWVAEEPDRRACAGCHEGPEPALFGRLTMPL